MFSKATLALRFFLSLPLSLALCLGDAHGEAAQRQSLAEIHQAVATFIKSRAEVPPQVHLEVDVRQLDPRLRLAACGKPLQTSLPAGSRLYGNTSVGVRCAGPKPWSVYVPATVRLYGNVLIAARSLPRGTTLKREDVQVARRELGRLRSGYFFDIEKAVGMVLERPVNPGMPLQATQLRAPSVVKRGEKVTLVAESSGFQVRMNGQAVMDGAVGDTIRVRNLSSSRIVQGVVTSAGVVEVRL